MFVRKTANSRPECAVDVQTLGLSVLKCKRHIEFGPTCAEFVFSVSVPAEQLIIRALTSWSAAAAPGVQVITADNTKGSVCAMIIIHSLLFSIAL